MSENEIPKEFEPRLLEVNDKKIENLVECCMGNYDRVGHQGLYGYESALNDFIGELYQMKLYCKTAEQYAATADNMLKRAKAIKEELSNHWDEENGGGYTKWILLP